MSQTDISPEDQAKFMQVMDGYEEFMRQEDIRISSLKASDHFTRCRDCGKFADKSRWVLRDSALALRGHRPLCAACFDEYDFDY